MSSAFSAVSLGLHRLDSASATAKSHLLVPEPLPALPDLNPEVIDRSECALYLYQLTK